MEKKVILIECSIHCSAYESTNGIPLPKAWVGDMGLSKITEQYLLIFLCELLLYTFHETSS